MTPVDRTNPLTRMLDTAFNKFDQNKDGKLNAEEYKDFYKILTPGIAVDKNGTPAISEQEYRNRMDANADGDVSLAEMQNTGVLMPASASENSLESTLQTLVNQTTERFFSVGHRPRERELPIAGQS
ncbi:hypothetical protein [Variovorax saccharolyticus]|uniref:hypothetical protein n=1 Tax=Variovorax saccharolyticus TaxID=3053516 RepID=UPI0025749A46|nr:MULTISPECIES: hypothetical protein [unclassified Variovorax]MDM0022312.1 hypothetical protein [Variovorax sp. J22R187]MDM0028868.1 hypothetical protein [Variovorax sp. J31P216]